MSGAAQGPSAVAFVQRALLYFAAWTVMLGALAPADAVVGALVSLAAARLSLALRPANETGLRWTTVAVVAGAFLRDSLVAGLDVARRAFSPAMPLRTGFVHYTPAIPPGDARCLFTGISSLMPGSVPVETDGPGEVVFHCLDTGQPVAAQLAKQEARLAAALGRPSARSPA